MPWQEPAWERRYRRSVRANTRFSPISSFPCWLLPWHHYAASRMTLEEGFIGRLRQADLFLFFAHPNTHPISAAIAALGALRRTQ